MAIKLDERKFCLLGPGGRRHREQNIFLCVTRMLMRDLFAVAYLIVELTAV